MKTLFFILYRRVGCSVLVSQDVRDTGLPALSLPWELEAFWLCFPSLPQTAAGLPRLATTETGTQRDTGSVCEHGLEEGSESASLSAFLVIHKSDGYKPQQCDPSSPSLDTFFCGKILNT